MRVPTVWCAVALGTMFLLSGCQNGSGWSLDSLAFWKTKPSSASLASRGAVPRPSTRSTPTGVASQPGYAQLSSPKVTYGVANASYNTQSGSPEGYAAKQQGYPAMQAGAGIPAQAGHWDPNSSSSSAPRMASATSGYSQYGRSTGGYGSGAGSGFSGTAPAYRSTSTSGYSRWEGYPGDSSAARTGYPSSASSTAGAYPQSTTTSSASAGYRYRSDAAQGSDHPFGSPNSVSYRSDTNYPGGRSRYGGSTAGGSAAGYPTGTGAYGSGPQSQAGSGAYPTGSSGTTGGYPASSGSYQPPNYEQQKGGYEPSGSYSPSGYNPPSRSSSQGSSSATRLTGLDPRQEYRPGSIARTGGYPIPTDTGSPSTVTNPYARGYPDGGSYDPAYSAGLPGGSTLR